MLNSLPIRLLWHSFNWLTRTAIVIATALLILVALLVILLRYWLLPNIEAYHDKITSSLSSAIASPLTIGRIEGGWEGWQPHLEFTDVRILDKQGQPALVLPSISNRLSWTSLLSGELRLASLKIDKPELLIHRDLLGKIYLGGVELAQQQGDNNDISDWLLHQHDMQVKNAYIVWWDEQRGAPPLVLTDVNLHVRSLFNRHRFALQAVPPADLAAPIDLRGDFHGVSFDDLQQWYGQAFLQFDYSDIDAWRAWVDLPKQLERGRGALRAWASLASGKVVQVTADLALRNVTARLAEDLPQMNLRSLHGRATWKAAEGGFEVDTRHLSLHLQNGLSLPATDAYLRIAAGKQQGLTEGEIRANQLQLATLAELSSYIPLPGDMREKITAYAPHGTVANLQAQWQATPERLHHYQVKGNFKNLALQRVGNMPGFSGLTADIDGSEASGKLTIKSHQLAIDAPDFLREPLTFNTLTGKAGWQRQGGELIMKLDELTASNQDLDGTAHASFSTAKDTPGVLDLTVKLTRGDISKAARYTPLIGLDREVNDWLHDALLSGQTNDLRIRIKGNLKDFPFKGNQTGVFEIAGHAEDGMVEIAKGWPHIENVSGDLFIQGNKLEFKFLSANMLDVQTRLGSVSLTDMLSDDMPLQVKVSADGASNAFLRFIQQSPVRGYIDGFTDDIRASGNAHLDLLATIPLAGNGQAKVDGLVRVQNNDIDVADNAPRLRNTSGELLFTQNTLHTRNLSAEILGGKSKLDVQSSADGIVHVKVDGRASMDTLRKINDQPLLQYLHGSSKWNADITVVKKSAQLVISSDLLGIRSSLPQPFTKRADESMQLRIEKKNVLNKQDVITAQLGKLLTARLLRREENGADVIRRGSIMFGGAQARLPDKDGLWLSGNVPVLSLQGWDKLADDSNDTAKNSSALAFGGAKLQIGKLVGYGQSFDTVRVDASKRGEGIAAQITGKALNGEVVWQPHGFQDGGKITAHLGNLQWLRAAQEKLPTQVKAPQPLTSLDPSDALQPGKLPAIEVSVENLRYNGKQIGRFEMVGHPDGTNWRLRRVRITNPDGDLIGDAVWQGATPNAQTQVNLVLDISDVGKILSRSGYPDTVKQGNGRLAANLSWLGSPDEFNYATLDGTLKLDTGKGQFLKIDPGVGKLLGVLSLQALPKRITLDFTDIFSNGFQFDNINGNATIRQGVIDTQDFHIDGSSAKVTMTGSVDLNHETQNLHVTVLPTLGDSVSVLGAFAGGPVVGIGTFIANKVLGNPLDKLVSFEYNVSGAWSNPDVVKVNRAVIKEK